MLSIHTMLYDFDVMEKTNMIKTILNPELVTIKPGFLGNQCRDDRFLNYKKVPVPTFSDIIHWRFSENPQKKEKEADTFSLSTNDNESIFNKAIDKMVWLGHASFLVTLSGKNILIDPVFYHVGIIKRRAKIPFSIERYNAIDYILISHAHYDHLDKKTVKKLTKLNPHLKIYCGLNTKALLQKWGIQHEIIEAAWYQQFPINDDQLQFYFMPCLHWSNRTLFDRNKRLWGSFIIKNNHNTIYFMGDSGYASHFLEIGSFFPEIDYAILGIGAYKPRYIMQSSHINPEEAYQAFTDLRAKYCVPMHYATYDMTDEPFSEPLQKIENLFLFKKEKLKKVMVGEMVKMDVASI